MTISEFSKKFYVSSDTIKSIGSHQVFIWELFRAAGSDYFPNNPKYDPSKKWILRSLFSGKRKLTLEMKESFPSEIDENRFITHFNNRISPKSLMKIMTSFLIDVEEPILELFLIALCTQFQAIVREEDDAAESIVKQEYERLVDFTTVESEKQQSDNLLENSVRILEARRQLPPVRLWLPDAELATEEQSEFASFTLTESIVDFIRAESQTWGIISSKGVGKTYILQKLRRDMQQYAIPYFRKLSKDNEWGTESIRFSDPIHLENSSLMQLAGLWQVSILCLVINSIGQYSDIDSMAQKELPGHITKILDNAKSYDCLDDIINSIISYPKWHNDILDNYSVLKRICNYLLNNRNDDKERPVAIFIDKVDQSILQPGAEIPECFDCYKDTMYENCNDPNKNTDYCLEQCGKCCFGCEKYASKYADEGLRVYGTQFGKRYEHISKWQHIQLALVLAVFNIGLGFKFRIRVYYAVRQEAFNAEDHILGGNAQKIMSHTKYLHYTKDEQEKIFINTIKIQPSEWLYNPNLRNKEDRISEAFVGINMLCHPFAQGKESLFDCIYRHSFDRAREIQYFGDALAVKIPELKRVQLEEREEMVKRIIETTAANLLFRSSGTLASGNRTYYGDKQILLRNYWANPENFKNFIRKLDRNMLFVDDMAHICKDINKSTDCDFMKCKEKQCKLHPFSMLHQIGLLGRISHDTSTKRDAIQLFTDSKDVTYYRDVDMLFPNAETIYLLHPALTKCIERNIRGVSIKHFRGFIIGKSLPVSSNVIGQLINDKTNMDNKLFVEKYYIKPNEI